MSDDFFPRYLDATGQREPSALGEICGAVILLIGFIAACVVLP
jgi:hypothetical protein